MHDKLLREINNLAAGLDEQGGGKKCGNYGIWRTDDESGDALYRHRPGAKIMNIIYSDLFEKECRRQFAVSAGRVRDAIRLSESKQIVHVDVLDIGLYLKRRDPGEHLFVLTQHSENKIIVFIALPLPADFVNAADTGDLLGLLRRFVEEYGLEMRIGDRTGKWFFDDKVPIKTRDLMKEIVIPEARAAEAMLNVMVRFDNTGGRLLLHCALVFCINRIRYKKWIGR